MRRAFGLMLLIGLLATALWWIVRDATHAPEGGSSPAVDSEAGVESTPSAGSASPSDNGAVAREIQPQGVSSGSDPELTDTLRLRFVREARGAGVPGVAVRFIDFDAPENANYRRDTRDFHRDPEAIAEDYGVIYVTAADGSVRLPRVGTSAIFARLQEEYAESVVGAATPDGFELLLQRDLEVRVRVVDPDGRPAAGASVAWLAWHGDVGRDQLSARSGADGIARLRHLQTRLPDSVGLRHTLALELATASGPQVAFDPQHPPAEIVELRLPATGSVVIEVLDADGHSFPDGTLVFLQEAPTEEQRADWDGYRPFPRSDGGANTALLLHGSVTFPFVGLGQRLEYGAYFEEAVDYFGAEADGLTAPGVELRLVLRLPEAPVRIVGRLLRADQTPIAEARVNVQLQAEGSGQGRRLNTGADGRFHFIVNERHLPPSPERRMWIAHTDPDVRRALTRQISLAEALGPGDHDFGDIILGAGAPLAAGRVVDESGQPMAGVRISIEIVRDGQGKVMLDFPGGPRRTANLTGPDGRFACYADGADTTDWRISFLREGFHPAALTGLSGREDHEVVLTRAARLRGRLVLDPSIPPDLLEVIWTREGQKESGSQVWVTLDSDLGFVTKDAVGGAGDLTISIKRNHELVEQVEHVVLQAGAEVDPRLDPLDLRGRLSAYKIRVLDAEGREPGRVNLILEGEARILDGYATNPLRLLMSESGRQISVLAPGSASARLTLDRTEIEVRLKPGVAVTYRLEGVEWPQEGLELRAEPTLLGAGRLEGFDAKFAEDGTAVATLPEAGRYELGLRLALMRNGKRVGETFIQLGWAGVAGSERVQFEWDPAQPAVEIPVRIRQVDLDEALQRMD